MATETLRPNANGSTIQFIPSTGSNYQNVDEVTADDDATYNYKNGTGTALDLYALPSTAIASGSTINSITVYVRARASGAMLGTAYLAIRTHSTNYTYEESGNTYYQTFSEVFTTNPNTGNAWTIDEINALEIGGQVTISYNPYNNQLRITQAYVVIDYTEGSTAIPAKLVMMV